MTSSLAQSEVRILIADDHPIFRQGLKQVIELDARLKVVAEAGTGQDTLAAVLSVKPQVALLDVDMPLGDGFSIARILQQQQSTVKIVFLTLYRDETHLNEALDIGVKGYIVKDSAAADVVECIRTVAAGAHYVSPALSSYLLNRGRPRMSAKRSEDAFLSALTAAERRIVKHLAEYKTNKQISQELGVSIRTIENHRATYAKNLDCKARMRWFDLLSRACGVSVPNLYRRRPVWYILRQLGKVVQQDPAQNPIANALCRFASHNRRQSSSDWMNAASTGPR